MILWTPACQALSPSAGGGHCPPFHGGGNRIREAKSVIQWISAGAGIWTQSFLTPNLYSFPSTHKCWLPDTVARTLPELCYPRPCPATKGLNWKDITQMKALRLWAGKWICSIEWRHLALNPDQSAPNHQSTAREGVLTKAILSGMWPCWQSPFSSTGCGHN